MEKKRTNSGPFMESTSKHSIYTQGDLLRLMTPGRGGWGNPIERDVARVRDDMLDGFVSLASALNDYGVMLYLQTLAVDVVETRQLRQRMRLQTAMFHWGCI